ncbi:MAG: MAG1210 family protein [Kiritimatiellia bacterium]
MIEDVYEPLARYRDEFRETFAALTREKFQALTQMSRVDVCANRLLVKRIKELQKKAASARTKKMCFAWLVALGMIGVLVALLGMLANQDAGLEVKGWWIAGIVASAVFSGFMLHRIHAVAKRLAKLEGKIETKKAIAWKQMEPLNRSYTWDLTVKLMEAAVPRLAFDPYFTVERLSSLRSDFGWDDSFNADKSILFAQSGVINGNPFVFGHYLDMEWGEQEYTGTKEISWAEWETGADGKRYRVRRYETLRATVKKPIPIYKEHKMLVYGNDAAPNLNFSRLPSGLSEKEGAFWNNIRKKKRLNDLKAYSRNLTDDSNFTLMANHEFETWFHAKDRDNEVEFRLLFTPIAQTQMLHLMKDTTVGYGDDFSFLKQGKINFLISRHLNEATIDTDPSRFRNWDYDDAAAFFQAFNERYFKDAYFALAPVLSIPLYQQMRTHKEIWKDVLRRRNSSFWEHEAVANYHGEEKFQHPDCITRSLLKTKIVQSEEGENTIAVTAHGYRGEERVCYEMVFGQDGKYHKVAVHWTEYLPVERTSNLCLCERETPSDRFRQLAASSKASAYRRSLLSFLAEG